MEVGLMWAPCRVWRGSLKGDASAVQQGWEPIADTQRPGRMGCPLRHTVELIFG
jgi:hypothetical protein